MFRYRAKRQLEERNDRVTPENALFDTPTGMCRRKRTCQKLGEDGRSGPGSGAGGRGIRMMICRKSIKLLWSVSRKADEPAV